MTGTKLDIPDRFAEQNFYEILHLTSSQCKSYTSDDIKKAYRKTALSVHPDLHQNNPHANQEFIYLTHVHETLSNPNKKQQYDDNGFKELQDDQDQDDFGNINTSSEYWRSVFPKFTMQDIEDYRQNYIDSSEEKDDVLVAFNRYGVDQLENVFYSVPFATSESVTRLCKLINAALDKKQQISAKIQNKLAKKMKQFELAEAEEAESALAELAESEQKLIRQSRKQALQITDGKPHSNNSNSADDALMQIIQARQNQRGGKHSFLDQLEFKYSNTNKSNSKKNNKRTHDQLDDVQFEQLQQKMDAKNKHKQQQTTASTKTPTNKKSKKK